MCQNGVQEVTSADAERVLPFLRRSSWTTLESSLVEVEKHLGAWPAWMAAQGGELSAFLLLDVLRAPVVQIHTVTCRDKRAVDHDLPELLQAASLYAEQHAALPPLYMGDSTWLRQPLARAGYHTLGDVLFYEKEGTDVPAAGNQAVEVRLADTTDIPALVALDSAAFAPIWRNNAAFFRHALCTFPLLYTACLGSVVAGYVLCDVRYEQGQLARLAVHPGWQRQGIGTRLLAEAMRFFAEAGVSSITLNTQEDNHRAQRLYRWFGFQRTGDRFFVMQASGS